MGTASRVAVWAVIGATVLAAATSFHAEAGTLPFGWTTNRSGDYDRYYYADRMRLAWNWSLGIWYHTSAFSTSYERISASGLAKDPTTSQPVTFLGDGTWRSLGNNLQYNYKAASDMGFFLKGTTLVATAQRFLYDYGKGQWWEMGVYGGWKVLGKAGLSPALGISEGMYGAAAVDMGGGLTFKYDVSSDIGTFSKVSGTTLSDRIRYTYYLGRWEHKGVYGEWARLGIDMLSSENMADIALTDLGVGMGFAYNALYDFSVFVLHKTTSTGTTNLVRLRYSYADGVWFHKGYGDTYSTIAFKTVNHLGTAVGRIDGMRPDSVYSLLNELTFLYSPYDDTATYYTQTSTGALTRFTYDYTSGIWKYTVPINPGVIQLNTAPLGSGLLNGDRWSIGNGWYFHYGPQYAGDPMSAIWGVNATEDGDRFAHKNSLADWWNRGKGDGGNNWQDLAGSSGWLFPGDGVAKAMRYGTPAWTFVYQKGLDKASFMMDGRWRFSYEYSTGTWRHQQNSFGWQILGTGLSPYFVGTAKLSTNIKTDRISIGNGWWYAFERVDSTHQRGYFYTADSDTAARFRIKYEAYPLDVTWSLWEHAGKDGSFYGFFNYNFHGSYTLPSVFDGFSTPTNVFVTSYQPDSYYDYTWKYYYNKGADQGVWTHDAVGSSEPWFIYNYSQGLWWHGREPRKVSALGVVNCGFIGDGKEHSLAGPGGYIYSLNKYHITSGLQGSWIKVDGSSPHTYYYASGSLYDGSTYVGVVDPPLYR
jgi:hypothetical protein